MGQFEPFNFVGFIPIDIPDLSEWQQLISWVPDKTVQERLNLRNTKFQSLDEARGHLNLDYYPVQVFVNPFIDDKRMSNAELFNYFRLHLNELVDNGFANFEPYAPEDKTTWQSDYFLNTMIHIDMRITNFLTNPDDGSVVATIQRDNSWVFTTVENDGDLKHPVSGNREFGFFIDEKTTKPIFYTRGADRTTRFIDLMFELNAYKTSDLLWRSFQEKFCAFVNENGGYAKMLPRNWNQFEWEDVKKKYYNPTNPYYYP